MQKVKDYGVAAAGGGMPAAFLNPEWHGTCIGRTQEVCALGMSLWALHTVQEA